MSIFMSLTKTSVCQYGYLYAQITGLTHHCSCVSSHLFPRLNLPNLPHPRLSLFVVPLSRTPCQGGKFLLYFQAICCHEEGQVGCTLFARCCRHLSPQFQPLRGRHPNWMGSSRSCWHHTCSQKHLDTHFHAVLLHFFLVAFSFAPNLFTLVLKSTPSVSTLSAKVTPSFLLN